MVHPSPETIASAAYVEVAVNAPVDNTFHYTIPDRWRGQLQPGHLVKVGWGSAVQPRYRGGPVEASA